LSHPARRHARDYVAVLILAGLAWAAFAPVRFDGREELFEIPAGTWKRRISGDLVEILPSEIHLTLGVRDILLLRNLDDVPQIFGPTVMMPGQSFRLPFGVASTYSFECSAHASGQMAVIVHPAPDSAWSRLRWRAGYWWRAIA
jgi:hypothetical protein